MDPNRTVFGACVVLLAIGIAGCAGAPKQEKLGGRTSTEMENVPLPECLPKNLDTPPIVVSGKRPIYPAGQLQSSHEGSGIVQFDVSETGAVSNIQSEWTGSKYFASHLVYALQTWKLAPAMRGGKPAPAHCMIEMNFKVLDGWPFNRVEK